jgi:hypothetical protein
LKFNIIVICLLVLCFVACFAVNAETQNNTTPTKRAIAVRANPQAPKIDGILDDEAWSKAPKFDDFLQKNPNEGAQPTERTVFQVLYDDEAVYFGVQCYNSKSNSLVCRLTRRDGWIETDRVTINLDPYFDRQTGYWFTAHVAGSVSDGVIYNDRMFDQNWDAVWEVKTKINENGWTAEYRIPYHVLRFSPKDEYTWGLNVERNICGKKEFDQWSLISSDRPGMVSRFGILEGIKGIHPPKHLELMPYSMGRTIREAKNDYSGNIGADVRYGITSGVSLNATVNPDFGQVEADPSELNLTAFESFLSERRPFFIEGASIFKNSDYDIFYSRRIGRFPEYNLIPEDAIEISRPEATNIISAAKITGKTAKKTSFGIMEAVTAPEYAKIERNIDGEIVKEDFLVEPLTNYFVGRLKQDILGGSSNVGLIATAVNRKDSEAGYVSSTDWSLNFRENKYEFSGTLAASNAMVDIPAEERKERKSGYLAHLEFDKKGGWIGGETALSALSPNLNMNDLGFTRRTDRIRWGAGLGLNRDKRLAIFRKCDLNLNGDLAWNYDGINTGKGLGLWFWGELLNYWWTNIGAGREFESMNDSEVRRNGPLMKNQPSLFFEGSIHTDSRKSVAFRLSPHIWRTDDGKSHGHGIGIEFETRPISNFEFRIEPSYNYHFAYSQWIDRFEEIVDNQTVYHYVFGELDNKTVNISMRGNVSFTPKLTLEIFLQPFVTIGDYSNIKELAKPESYEFKPYSLGWNNDFHYRSLKGNMVLRWEFRPGSTLYVVWSQSKWMTIDGAMQDDLELRPFERLKSTFSDYGKNVFLIKVNYWIGA